MCTLSSEYQSSALQIGMAPFKPLLFLFLQAKWGFSEIPFGKFPNLRYPLKSPMFISSLRKM